MNLWNRVEQALENPELVTQALLGFLEDPRSKQLRCEKHGRLLYVYTRAAINKTRAWRRLRDGLWSEVGEVWIPEKTLDTTFEGAYRLWSKARTEYHNAPCLCDV